MNKLIIAIFIVISLPFLTNCAHENSGKITHLAEYNQRLYVSMDDNILKSYDTKRDAFKTVSIEDGYRITALIPVNDKLIFEASKMEQCCPSKTYENICFMPETLQTKNYINVVTDGYKQYESSLIAADNKYIYALRNDLVKTANNKYEWVIISFRYNQKLNKRIENHFDQDLNLIVQDVYEDNIYYWYVCYSKPIATHWTSVKGNIVIVRTEKITNKQRIIALGNDIFEKKVYLTGDNSFIWVFAEHWYKNNVFKISKEDLTYNTFRISDFTNLIKDNSNHTDSPFLWLINSKNKLYRFDKRNFRTTSISLPGENIIYDRLAVSDDKFIWLAQSQTVSNMPVRHSSYLLRVSKSDASSRAIPIETTFSEAINNMKNNFKHNMIIFFYRLIVTE